ncbi:M15 family metallopeptidase [Hymenobacter fodinae]|uniref:M15 family peptidase n=1 Tax=Hymenobacter fodinae TaxID=2510796 RepID=A0A4Z0NZ72_9BACT|nr:M15 family metallopeptidase [Hymenobacter fodinae]TGE03842.1 M15 family peptidase [Hymenobacter fodinae]
MASRSLDDLHPLLAQAYRRARDEYHQKYPQRPQPFVTCTYRSQEEQKALHAQGRLPLTEINQLRNAAGMTPIGASEGQKRVTNASPGQSAHNYRPALAFDVAFITTDQRVDWNPQLFALFAPLVLAVAGTEWGGAWTSFQDSPHFQLRDWRTYLNASRPRTREAIAATEEPLHEIENFNPERTEELAEAPPTALRSQQ